MFIAINMVAFSFFKIAPDDWSDRSDFPTSAKQHLPENREGFKEFWRQKGFFHDVSSCSSEPFGIKLTHKPTSSPELLCWNMNQQSHVYQLSIPHIQPLKCVVGCFWPHISNVFHIYNNGPQSPSRGCRWDFCGDPAGFVVAAPQK